MTVAIGTVQRATLRKLLWAPQIAPADDTALASLRRLGLAASLPVPASGARAAQLAALQRDAAREWRITIAGLSALGIDIPDEEPTLQTEQAA